MGEDRAIRWVPVNGLPELPLGELNIIYTASENRLTVHAFFADRSASFPQHEPPREGVIIEFENVQAFKVYAEFTDPIYAAGIDVPLLAHDVPYGGTWGFIQMINSSWIERLALRNAGWEASTASHWVIKSGDMVLHVASVPSLTPTFRGRIARSASA